ncbi:family 78 glycoside hydrolase catalytic domain [Aquibacillus albus]|uniref:alpha-L-rhamnosidase n=1 Tax=Aquibacillus albus TaxID=1168171 RepID=A0ABS2MZD8_9BACI|nr:family 78 glycoside hydrolase catalytic domain [Aquibacillus albus]MBM7571266.1 hypothetical protein [Aquibacillus albus]
MIKTSAGKPTGLLVEFLSVPLGIETEKPNFSWIVNDRSNGERQSAYKILVATDYKKLLDNEGDQWDSGKVVSSKSSNVRYLGKALQSQTIYYWKVKTWNSTGKESPYSNIQMFTTAVKDNWDATPIWLQDSTTNNFAFFRKSFPLKHKQINKAIAHVTALSPDEAAQYVYKLSINGKVVGTGPERGFNGINRYTTFDVTNFLISGQENVIGALNYTESDKRFLFQMNVFYTDGTVEKVISDQSWNGLNAKNIYVDGGNAGNDLYYYVPRENIDATKYPFGWDEAGFDDSNWEQVTKKEIIQNLQSSPTRNTERRIVKPVKIVHKGNNNYFIDFGKAVVGSLRLELDNKGNSGHQIDIKYGEELQEQESVRSMRTDNTYEEVWTLKEQKQVIEQWGYRVIRYAEVKNFPVELKEEHFSVIALHHPFDDQAALFESSDQTLNDVWDFVKYSIKATALDVYVDTHTRERRNYEGDAYINQLSQYSMDREYAFARYSMEYLYYRPTWPTEYKQQTVMMAWEDYMYTGNTESLEKYYNILKTKTLSDYLNDEGLVEKSEENDLVDWPLTQRDGYQFSTINTVINTFQYIAIKHLANIANILGLKEDAQLFANQAEKMFDAVNKYLYSEEAGKFKDGKNIDHYALHASAFPLAVGLVSEKNQESAANYAASKGMAVSVYGSQFLLDGLYNSGKSHAALSLMTSKDMNSWGHLMYDLGATIVTEAWDPEQKPNMSYSHAWASAPANIIPRQLFGVQPIEPGFNKIQIKPQPAHLEWAKLKVPSIKGPIEAEFENKENRFILKINIPANTTAKVYLPKLNINHNRVKANEQNVAGDENGDFVVIDDVGSGVNTFIRE